MKRLALLLLVSLLTGCSTTRVTSPAWARSGQYADGLSSYVGREYQGHRETNELFADMEPIEALAIKIVATEMIIYYTGTMPEGPVRDFCYFITGAYGWYLGITNIALEF